MKIVVAMSGGVDSSTVAGLMVEAGHEVIGLAMKTHSVDNATGPRQNRACCTPDDMRDARRVADHFNIPFYVLNYEDIFHETIVKPFAEAYHNGETPNPCVECNDKVKFRPMLERAQLLGADFLATGHYARLDRQGDTVYLQRGVDPKKDQSYFLYRLSQEQLRQVMFPIGGMTKAEVRDAARRMGLSVAEKAESQEICFVGNEGYGKTVEAIAGPGAAGNVVDGSGRAIGTHSGVHNFTIGQRRGLRIAAQEPLYVTDVDGATGQVRVGSRADLLAPSMVMNHVTWSAEPPSPDERVFVQQRYREVPKAARVRPLAGGLWQLDFEQPEMRGAPGQAAVVYRGESVLGGGRLVRAPNVQSEVAPVAAGAPA